MPGPLAPWDSRKMGPSPESWAFDCPSPAQMQLRGPDTSGQILALWLTCPHPGMQWQGKGQVKRIDQQPRGPWALGSLKEQRADPQSPGSPCDPRRPPNASSAPPLPFPSHCRLSQIKVFTNISYV
jgi:hypothetical protein